MYGQKLNNKLYVFGNPFDVNKIREMSNKPSPKELDEILKNNRCLVNVGSFKQAKNHANLLKAFEIIAREVKDVVLILVGADLYLKGQIEEMAKQSSYSDRIVFTGELNNPFAVEKKCSVFVFPSLAEGIPNALAEAMIVGLPVVSTNCPTGPAELLSKTPFEICYNEQGYCDSDYGVLVKPFTGPSLPNYNDINEEHLRFATPIIKALTDNHYYNELVKKSHLGSERFNIENYKGGLVQLINKIVYG